MEKKISGWGNNNFINSKIYFPKNISEIKKLIKPKTIARGLGRSYGDSSIQPNSTVITTRLDKMLYFNVKTGVIEAESGITIESMLEAIVKKGWFLPVTPGSKKITLGGMIASNVHGKNHHKVGSFKSHIINLKIINQNKKLLTCSKKTNKKLFNYTVGGMGLTGIIYSCKFKLKKIKSDLIYQEKIKNNNLKETINSIKKSHNWEYNVSWIDTSANKKNLGRSILTRGKFVDKKINKFNIYKNKKKILFPKIFPSWFIGRFIIRLLNILYFNFNSLDKIKTDIDSFFYPLDKIENWNVAYGKSGFISYQCLIPNKNSYKVIKKILNIIKDNKTYSFVSVLKSMGKNDGHLSFGSPGFTIVFDFPIYKNIYTTLDEIDQIVLANNGKLYLTKDSRVDKDKFRRINKEFFSDTFKKFRNSNSKIFSSLQSERLKI
jgi:decaprenylphospho-beta-D-ribofuranose 2-oxidase